MTVSLLVATNDLVAAVYAPPADIADPDYAGPVVVDWGDGTPPVPALLGVVGAQVVHAYGAGGDYTIAATGRLANGARYEQTLTLTFPAAAVVDIPMVDQGIDGELPSTGPVSLVAGVDVGSPGDAARVQGIIDAVNAQVRTWRTAEKSRGFASWWPPTVEGSNMLVRRLWRRKDTPAGVEVFGDAGIAYVRRLDPDVAQLLELGDWSTPGVG